MPITVHFATNRALTGPVDQVTSYGTGIVAPTDPTAMTYGTAFVADAQLNADTEGAVNSIEDITKGQFSDSARGDLSAPGRNLLVFIHGFNNTFEAAITRAAFITQWFAGSGVPGTDTSVVAFSWPSLGKLFSFPDLEGDYRTDQMTAGQSGAHLMSFFANLQPLLAAARRSGTARDPGQRTAWATGCCKRDWKAGSRTTRDPPCCSTPPSSRPPTKSMTVSITPIRAG